MVAHGGTAGLLVEASVVLAVVALAAAAWLGMRKHGDDV